MKIIFLDFDGVLNSKQEVIWHHRQDGTHWYDVWLVKKLERLISRSLDYLWYKKKMCHSWHSWWTDFYLMHLCDHCDFDPIACSNVQYVLDKTPDCMVVVSSSWRSWGLEGCRKILARNGIDPKRVIDTTERKAHRSEGGQRGDQIKRWLDVNALRAREHYVPERLKTEPVTHFVAIDDDDDMDTIRANFVRTDNHIGFTMRDAYKCLKILDGELGPNETLFG